MRWPGSQDGKERHLQPQPSQEGHRPRPAACPSSLTQLRPNPFLSSIKHACNLLFWFHPSRWWWGLATCSGAGKRPGWRQCAPEARQQRVLRLDRPPAPPPPCHLLATAAPLPSVGWLPFRPCITSLLLDTNVLSLSLSLSVVGRNGESRFRDSQPSARALSLQHPKNKHTHHEKVLAS